jgi:hypothetical protein
MHLKGESNGQRYGQREAGNQEAEKEEVKEAVSFQRSAVSLPGLAGS